MHDWLVLSRKIVSHQDQNIKKREGSVVVKHHRYSQIKRRSQTPFIIIWKKKVVGSLCEYSDIIENIYSIWDSNRYWLSLIREDIWLDFKN